MALLPVPPQGWSAVSLTRVARSRGLLQRAEQGPGFLHPGGRVKAGKIKSMESCVAGLSPFQADALDNDRLVL